MLVNNCVVEHFPAHLNVRKSCKSEPINHREHSHTAKSIIRNHALLSNA